MLEKHFLVELEAMSEMALLVMMLEYQSVLVWMLKRISSGCRKQMDVYKKHELMSVAATFMCAFVLRRRSIWCTTPVLAPQSLSAPDTDP